MVSMRVFCIDLGVNSFHLVIGSRNSKMMLKHVHVPSCSDSGVREDEDKEVEKSLLKKVDKRMSVLVLIYILNCGSPFHT